MIEHQGLCRAKDVRRKDLLCAVWHATWVEKDEAFFDAFEGAGQTRDKLHKY